MKIVISYIFLFLLTFQPALLAQDAHKSKLTFGQTAKPLQAGQGYVNTLNGLFFDGEVGVTSFLSVGVGTSIYTFFNQELYIPNRGVGFKAKLAFSLNEKTHIGISHTLIRQKEENIFDPVWFNITKGMISFDIASSQLTLGAGITTRHVDASPEDKIRPLIYFGAIVPVMKNGYIVNETWSVFYETNKIDLAYTLRSLLVFRWMYKRFSFEGGASGIVFEDGDGGYIGVRPQAGISFYF